jgi:hypothetical protein
MGCPGATCLPAAWIEEQRVQRAMGFAACQFAAQLLDHIQLCQWYMTFSQALSGVLASVQYTRETICKFPWQGLSLKSTPSLCPFSTPNFSYLPKTPVCNWYRVSLLNTSFSFINKAGVTQLRLHFTKDVNNNSIADYLKFFSGNAGAAYRPQLIIEYYIP